MSSDTTNQTTQAQEQNTENSHHEHHPHHHHHHEHGHDVSHDASHIHQHLHDVNAAHFDAHVASPDSVTLTSWQRMYQLFDKELVEQRHWYGLRPALKNAATNTTTNATTNPPDLSDPSDPSSTATTTRPVRMLDYACGGGHASRTLLPYVDQVRGADVSGKSIEAYNAWARDQGIPASVMCGVQGNIMTDSGLAALDAALFTTNGTDTKTAETAETAETTTTTTTPTDPNDVQAFDLVVCIMALHHISDQPLAIRRLADRLRPGGSLLVIDWNHEGNLRFKGKEHAAKHTTIAHGFGEEVMRGFMTGAGLVGFGYRELLGFTEDGVAAMSTARKAW